MGRSLSAIPFKPGDDDANGIDVNTLTLGTDVVRDRAGNSSATTEWAINVNLFTTKIDATPPTISSVSVPADATYAVGQNLDFTLNFSEAVTRGGTDSSLGLTVGSVARSAAFHSSAGSTVTYRYAVQAGDTDTDGITVGALSLGTSTIRDAAGNDADLSLTGHVPVTTGVLVDAVAPTFVQATVEGSQLVLTYADAAPLDAANPPAASAFAVMVAGDLVGVTAVAVDANARTVTLTLSSSVGFSQAVTAAYTDPTGGNDVNAIQDSLGNDAASLAATAATNNTPEPEPEPDPEPVTPLPTTSEVDGVLVQTITGTASDGTPVRTVTIPVIQPGRQDQLGGDEFADIPLVTTGDGQPLLQVQVPTGLGLTSTGPTTLGAAGSALADLIREIKAHTTAGSSDQSQLTGGVSGFLGALAADTPMVIQTIVLSGTGDGLPLVISGPPIGSSPVQMALVIDTTRLPAGASIELHGVHFAAIIGAATVTGGTGSQHVWGDGASQSIFLGADDDVLHGGGGNDTVGSGGGNDQIFGGDGDDVVFGGDDNDVVHGNAGDDVVRGDAGDDRLHGGKGDDQVFGGDGADLLFGDDGADLLFGDLGDDILQGNLGQDTLNGGDGADRMHGGQGSDVLLGGDGADLLFGDLGDDVLQGNTGADTLEGGAGDDRLHGGRDNDVLFGGDGDDLISGDAGDDVMTGGAGADLFTTWGGGTDRVLDFNFAQGDRLGYAAETTYNLAQVGADTVVILAGGAQTILVNVQIASLGDGWIIAV